MKRTISVLMIAILVILSEFSFSQNEGIKKGDNELNFNGFLHSVTGTGSTNANGNFSFSYGTYLTRHFLLGLGPGLSISARGSEKIEADFNAKVFARINFTSKKTFIPYCNAQYFQYSFKKEDNAKFFDNGYIQGGIGFLAFFNQYLAMDTQINYGINVKESSVGLLQLSIGINYIF